MTRFPCIAGALGACLAFVAFGGCSDAAKAPPKFKIDAPQAAQEAMRLYDANHDGTLDAKELEASPALGEMLVHIRRADSAHPDSLTAADIQQRLEGWLSDPGILVSGQFTVLLDGRPLAGATVTFEPEPFLGSSYHAHQGQTDAAGMANLDSELPDYPHFLYVGLYRVRVSKVVGGKETIPAKYNTETTLGRELATGTGDPHESVSIRLSSK